MKLYKVISAPKKVADWKGKLIRFKRDLRNGNGIIAAGTFAQVSSQGWVTYFTCEKCEHCGYQPSISIKGDRETKLQDIEFIEIEEPSPPENGKDNELKPYYYSIYNDKNQAIYCPTKFGMGFFPEKVILLHRINHAIKVLKDIGIGKNKKTDIINSLKEVKAALAERIL